MFSKLSAMFKHKKRNCLRLVKCNVQSASAIVKDLNLSKCVQSTVCLATARAGKIKRTRADKRRNAKKELNDRYSVILTSRLLNYAYLNIRYIIVCRPYYCILH